MSNVKFANIAGLMSTYNFGFVTEILPDNLKCVKCKLTLKDACQVPCGCRFCRVCINNMMVSGSEFCPGVSKHCQESLLLDFVIDYVANRSVSQLTVKCPQNGCVLVCELAELEEHMRVCGRKSVACPFHELGCQQDKLAAEEMSGHFQEENRSHCEILIGMIGDINKEMESHKREIEILKRSDECRKMENEMLKYELVVKDEKIRSIIDQVGHVQNEMKSIKAENTDLADRVRILSEKIDGEFDERRESDERDMTTLIEHIDKKITAIAAVIGSNKDELVMDMTSFKDDIRSINQDRIKSIKNDIDCIKSQIPLLQALVALGQIDASCEWTINEDIGKTGWLHRSSEYFTGAVYPYRYQLESRNYISESIFGIRLLIYYGASDTHLPCTMPCAVTITVADRNKRKVYQRVTKQCEINKPANHHYRCIDLFTFPHFSLIGAGLYLAHGVHVSCVIIPTRMGDDVVHDTNTVLH